MTDNWNGEDIIKGQMEIYEAMKAKRLAQVPVTIDWETNCVNAIQGQILNNEYMKEHYSKILHRVLINLDLMKEQL